MVDQHQLAPEHYRTTSIGLALADTLDDMIASGKIEPQLANRVIQNFDQCIADVLHEKVKARVDPKGGLDSYRFVDDVWKFVLKEVSFKTYTGEKIEDSAKMTVIAMPAKGADTSTKGHKRP